MALTSLQAAKRLCELSGWQLSNLELHKMLYIAHMAHMGEYNGDPLVSDHFEAWDYGPVLPRLYHRAKIYGRDPVKNIFRSVSTGEDDRALATLADAYNALHDETPGQLVARTHWKNGAWAKYYRSGTRGIVIPNSAIMEEYQAITGQ